MQENELKVFIKENAILIYEYINSEILKNIGTLSPDFFVRLIEEFFNKNEKRVCTNNLTADTLGYYLITEVLGEAKQAFPFYRKDTLCLDEIFKEAKVYFNHVKFTIKNDIFTISNNFLNFFWSFKNYLIIKNISSIFCFRIFFISRIF